MKKRIVVGALATCGLLAFGASAQPIEGSYDWEDGGVNLGQFDNDNLTCTNSTEQANSGVASMKMVEDPADGTPQAYVAFIENLEDGDVITASFWMYDTTPGQSSDGYPSGRIWAHYADNGDVNSYRGSAGGNGTYSDGVGWERLEYSWTFVAGDPIRDAAVIEARIYVGEAGQFLYVDDVEISVESASGNATITFPSGSTDCLTLTNTGYVGGEDVTWTISGGTPGQKGVVVYGFNAGSLELNNFPASGREWCASVGIAGVNASKVVGNPKVLDANGEAAWTKTMPVNQVGNTILTQALGSDTCPDDCQSAVDSTTVQ